VRAFMLRRLQLCPFPLRSGKACLHPFRDQGRILARFQVATLVYVSVLSAVDNARNRV
jgi:hypothetical protein